MLLKIVFFSFQTLAKICLRLEIDVEFSGKLISMGFCRFADARRRNRQTSSICSERKTMWNLNLCDNQNRKIKFRYSVIWMRPTSWPGFENLSNISIYRGRSLYLWMRKFRCQSQTPHYSINAVLQYLPETFLFYALIFFANISSRVFLQINSIIARFPFKFFSIWIKFVRPVKDKKLAV